MAVATEKTATELLLTKLVAAADHYATSSPAVARQYMNKVERMKSVMGMKATAPQVCCEYCNSIFRPDNHIVRFIPRMRTNGKLARLILNRPEAKMGQLRRKLANLYIYRSTRVVITCNACEKRTIIKTKRSPELNLPQLAKTCTRTVKDVKLTKAEKKKLKKKRKWEERHQSRDSGMDMSGSGLDDTQSLHQTLNSSGLQPFKVGSPKFASTPLVSMNADKYGKALTKLPPANPFSGLNTIKINMQKQSATSGSKAKKRKGSQKTLQNILALEQKEDKKAESGGLHHFLSSL